MRDVRVRPVTPADAAALAATSPDAYRRNRELGFPAKAGSATAEQVAEWIHEYTVPVAVADGEVVGGVRLGHPEPGVAKLGRFGVRETITGEGIGSRLLAAAEDVARERGDERVRSTTPEAHPFLVEFYRSREYEAVDDPLEFRDYDEVVLETELD